MHVTLNARCSVVAAANPVYGSFDPTLDLAKNIGMPDSLLSRFDLVFVVRDVTTEETDRKIASQVIRQAQLRLGMEDGRRRGVEQMHSSILQRKQESDRQREQEATEVFEKRTQSAEGEERPEVVTVDFLRKYLRYCRRFTPVLSEEAQLEVADRYVDMRMRFQSGYAEQFDGASSESRKPRLAVTTRTLEALIRLATAHAKLKLRKKEVLKEDVVEAYKLMLGAREEEPSPSLQAPPPAPGGGPAPVAESDEPPAKRRKEGTSAEVSKERLDSLQKIAAQVFAAQRAKDILRGELFEQINARVMGGEEPFSEAEFERALAFMEAKNKVFVNPESGDVTLLD